MSNILKYIEILSIEQVEDKYYLQIALHSNQVTEVYWQIDEVTYENLYLQCDFNGSNRYRLSFKIIENPLINKLVGRITRTYLMDSSMIDFQTTKEFKSQLQLIKTHCQMNTLYQLSFIEENIHGLYVEAPEEETQVAIAPIQNVEAETTETNVVVDSVVEAPLSELENIEDTDTIDLDESISETERIDVSKTAEEEIDIAEPQLAEQSEPLELAENVDADQQIEQEPPVENEQTEELLEVAVEQQDLSDSLELVKDNETETAVEQQNTAVETLLGVPPELEQASEAVPKEKQNQATTLAKLVEENMQEAVSEHNVASELKNGQPTVAMHSQPIQTLLTLPAIKHHLPEATPIQTVTEDPASNATEAEVKTEIPVEAESSIEMEELIEAEAVPESSIEESNITAEEKSVEVPLLVNEAATSVEPVTSVAQLTEEPNTEAVKQAAPEKEAEETHHISNNMIALLAVAVAIFIAVAIYFAFFQQNANTLNTETAIANEITNAVTYNIEESFTFSLPKEYVALTFNRGPSPYTEEILNILKQYNYGATFFLQGNQVSLYPDIVKTVDANGHSIGHITNSHTLLTILEIDDQREALTKPKEEIEQLINKETLLVRPPFNTFNKSTISIQQELDLKIVNSSIALKSGDDINTNQLLKAFDAETLEGAIIGLDESQATVEALPTILDKIKQSDLQVVILK